MVWKLLRKNISAGQILGYSLASLIGLSIVISAVKFYSDVHSAFSGEDPLLTGDYLIISKPVSTTTMLGNKTSGNFTAKEIADLNRQPWVDTVGAFQAAGFNVNAAIDFGGKGMSTQLFFEAIPDTFLDVTPDQWSFDSPAAPKDATAQQIADIQIPVILSRDYLALYNFGYASARGLPQLNEKLIQSVPITFYLSGDGRTDAFRGRIVGFSSRLNTVAVPMSFMDWANARYGAEADSQSPSRLIIRTNAEGDPGIQKYMETHSYEIAGDKTDNSRANYFLRVATTIIIGVGALITALALFILMLSIVLLLQKNKQKLHDLMLLGYSPLQVSRPYIIMVCAINLCVLVGAIMVMTVASMYWTDKLSVIDITSASPLAAIAVGIGIAAALTLINCMAIRHIVRKNFFS